MTNLAASAVVLSLLLLAFVPTAHAITFRLVYRTPFCFLEDRPQDSVHHPPQHHDV